MVAPCPQRTRCSPGRAVGLLHRFHGDCRSAAACLGGCSFSPAAGGLDLQDLQARSRSLCRPARTAPVVKWIRSWARSCYITPTRGARRGAGQAWSEADAGPGRPGLRAVERGRPFLSAPRSFSLQLTRPILPGTAVSSPAEHALFSGGKLRGGRREERTSEQSDPATLKTRSRRSAILVFAVSCANEPHHSTWCCGTREEALLRLQSKGI